ncbi:unnamed protein product, partial [Symbiodinium natans]
MQACCFDLFFEEYELTVSHDEASDESPGQPGQLYVAVWNAAAGAEAKFRKSVRPKDAAHDLSSQEYDIIICPESGRENRAAFRGEGYRTIDGDKGIKIFYWPVLKPCPNSLTKAEIPGVARPGTLVSQLFKNVETDETVLVTGLHAGHYGNSEQAMKLIRDTQRDMLKRSPVRVNKVIVGGDFNELGDLIKEDRDSWMPLPLDHHGKPLLRHCRGSIHAKRTLKCGVTADHIWVGGNPEGYTADHLAKVHELYVDVDIGDTVKSLGHRLTLDQTHVNGVNVVLEQALTTSNVEDVLKHLGVLQQSGSSRWSPASGFNLDVHVHEVHASDMWVRAKLNLAGMYGVLTQVPNITWHDFETQVKPNSTD